MKYFIVCTTIIILIYAFDLLLYIEVVNTLTGKNNFDYHYDENDRERKVEVDFKTPFRRMRYNKKIHDNNLKLLKNYCQFC